MKHSSTLLVFCLLASLLSCRTQGDSELEAYLNTIRQSRMTVEAQGSLRTIAGVRAKLRAIQFAKDESGDYYSTSWISLSCQRPDMDSAAIARHDAYVDSLIQTQMAVLRPLVDKDGSGFVTTEEAAEFSDLVVDQLLAMYISEVEHGSEEQFIRAKRLTPVRLSSLKSRYAVLHQKAVELAISDIPPWPFQ
jgi:hypothetical protein